MTTSVTEGYLLGRDFGAGDREHAVPADAQIVGDPRSTRHDGYKAPYVALCGLEVWEPYDRVTYQGLPWEPGQVRTCKTCQRAAARRAGS